MSALEDAVETLANALDALEAKLDERLGDLAHYADAVDAARRQARTARTHAGEAAEGLAEAISELKALISASGEE